MVNQRPDMLNISEHNPNNFDTQKSTQTVQFMAHTLIVFNIVSSFLYKKKTIQGKQPCLKTSNISLL